MAAAEPASRRLLATLALGACLTLAVAFPAGAADSLAIVGATVIDGAGSAALADGVLVVEKGKVRSIGPRSHALLPKGIPYVDGSGLFVLPGRVRDAKVKAALRAQLAGGATFEQALAHILRAG